MAKLTILKGLPASGKSRMARLLVKQDASKKTVRVNRDDLRKMLFAGEEWSPKREAITIGAEEALVRELIGGHNLNVVVDDTNLGKSLKKWERFQCVNLNETEVMPMTASLEVCIQRDAWRKEGRVGRAVIENMALRSGLIKWEGLPVTIFDLDGTIANIEHRVHHLEYNKDAEKPKKDWKSFHAGIPDDTPYPEIVDLMREMSMRDHEIVILSGRGTESAVQTDDWLRKHQVPFDHIFMRDGGDYRPDNIVKREIYDRLVASGMPKPVLVVDDRPRVIAVWKELGLNVLEVHQEHWVGKGDV
jgi:hypothetical protein